MKFEALKVGELARRTDLTVRTLHHYDEIGLLKPSLHTEAGYRLYTRGDVARLQQVLSLRQLGFALEEIRDCLDRPGFAPLEVIRLHVARLREQIELQRKLCERLEALAEHFRTAEEVSADVFLYTIEVMTMIENYYTPEQMESFRKRREEAAAAGQEPAEIARQGQADWNALLAQYKADGEGHRPVRPPVAGAGEAPAGPGERLQRWRRGDRAEPQTTLDGAGRQALRPVRHRPEGDGVPRQGGRGGEEGLTRNSFSREPGASAAAALAPGSRLTVPAAPNRGG